MTSIRAKLSSIPWIFYALSATGLSVAAFMMYATWHHNPQGEFHDEAKIQWVSWLWVGVSWFCAITVIPSALIGLIYIATSHRIRAEKPMA